MSLGKAFGRTILGAVLGASLLATAAIPAHADQDDKCRRDIHKAEQNLEKAIRKHGEHSRQAEERRRQFEELRERCHMRDEHRGDDHDRDHR
ncbi:MAG: hypothetical protein WA628_09470 [Terriglobales bacterium]